MYLVVYVDDIVITGNGLEGMSPLKTTFVQSVSNQKFGEVKLIF